MSGNAAQRGDEASQGRGEYEWCELTDSDASHEVLQNRRMFLRLPGGVEIDTRCVLGYDGEKQKKNRIRNIPEAKGTHGNYPQYHLGVALMLPLPTRKEQNWGGGLPILRTEQYSIEDIFLGPVTTVGEGGAIADATAIRIQNQYSSDDISVTDRMTDVERVWENKDQFEPELTALIEKHEQLVRGGGAIAVPGKTLIREIQEMTAELSSDYPNIPGSSSNGDPLPTLLHMIGMRSQPQEVPIEEIPPEEQEIRRREVKKLRMQVSRGREAAIFRRKVKEAYNWTCVVCGLRLPQVAPGGSPGVDAAHILPYSDFDLETVSNGLCLCKTHHWAFDEGLFEIRGDGGGGYELVIPDEAKALAAGRGVDLAFLLQYQGTVSAARLPPRAADRPKPEYLAQLREIIYPG